jgi:hypothetical protein
MQVISHLTPYFYPLLLTLESHAAYLRSSRRLVGDQFSDLANCDCLTLDYVSLCPAGLDTDVPGLAM